MVSFAESVVLEEQPAVDQFLTIVSHKCVREDLCTPRENRAAVLVWLSDTPNVHIYADLCAVGTKLTVLFTWLDFLVCLSRVKFFIRVFVLCQSKDFL